MPHEAPPCPTLLGKIHEGSQRPRQSCASRSLHAPVPMGQLHVPKRQHQTSHFPSSQPAQERILNTSTLRATSPQLEQARCLGGPETHFTSPNFAPFQSPASCNKEAAGIGKQFISGFPQRSSWGSSFGTPRAHNPLRSFRSPRIRRSSPCTQQKSGVSPSPTLKSRRLQLPGAMPQDAQHHYWALPGISSQAAETHTWEQSLCPQHRCDPIFYFAFALWVP